MWCITRMRRSEVPAWTRDFATAPSHHLSLIALAPPPNSGCGFAVAEESG